MLHLKKNAFDENGIHSIYKVRVTPESAIIKIKIYAPAFISHEQINADGMVTLEEHATLFDLYRRLKLPLVLRLSFFCSVNYEPAKWNQKLKDGDTVTFLFPIPGG
jgi:hypothetical protein